MDPGAYEKPAAARIATAGRGGSQPELASGANQHQALVGEVWVDSASVDSAVVASAVAPRLIVA